MTKAEPLEAPPMASSGATSPSPQSQREHGWPPLPSVPVQPLQPRALYESLADRVRERILRHEFKPGDPIDEAALLRDYGISRTPVREALKLLNHEGLLTARPRRGMIVTVLTPNEIEEATRLYRLLQADAQLQKMHGHSVGKLHQRMLEMVQRHLRLAYGPSFEAQVK